MLFRRLAALLVIVAFAAAPSAGPAQARHDTVVLSAAAKKPPAWHRAARREQPVRQIACTKLGCSPVPPGCHPAPGFDWRGLPTGFDVVVCR